MAQDTETVPSITIDGHHILKGVDTFTYLRSVISGTLLIKAQVNSRIAKAAVVMAKMNKRVGSNSLLTAKTKMQVCQTCIHSTLHYSSKVLTTCVRQEKRLNSFLFCCLRHILHITRQARLTNMEVLQHVGIPSMFPLLSQQSLRWLGHLRQMDPSLIPKDLLNSKLSKGTRPVGWPYLCCKDVHKRDMKLSGIDLYSWKDAANEFSAWILIVWRGLQRAESIRFKELADRRARWKKRTASSWMELFNYHMKCSSSWQISLCYTTVFQRCRDAINLILVLARYILPLIPV